MDPFINPVTNIIKDEIMINSPAMTCGSSAFNPYLTIRSNEKYQVETVTRIPRIAWMYPLNLNSFLHHL
jgi:hypothetical protein